ncbi:MAG: TAXI family TRAP transporter solute-binding subunit [Geminicoccaceae bacterium]
MSRLRTALIMPFAKSLRGFATFILSLVLITSFSDRHARSQEVDDRPSAYTLSTATTGGAFHQGGVSLEALVKIKLLPNQRIDLTTKNSSGSMENITRLSNRGSDFAIVQALLGHHASQGTGPARQMGPQHDLHAVTMLWPNVEHFIVKNSATPNKSIKDLLKLKGQRMSFGREASAIESNRHLLGNLGMDIVQDFEQALLGFRSSTNAFRRGEIDGLSLPASTPVPAFVDLIGQLGPDAVILNWTEDDLEAADGGLGLWSLLSIPAETYPNQAEVVNTIAQPNFLAVRADVDEEVVYAITKAIFENLSFLRRLHQPFQFLTLENAIDGLPVPLHPGALRYFQENGLELKEAVFAEHDYDVFGKEAKGIEQIRQEVGNGVVSLMTPEDGTSDQLVNELLDVISDEKDLRVLPLKGRGTAHNLADLLYLSGVDVSVLQADAMEFARQQGVFPDLTKKLRYITKWHDLEVHLLVQDDVLRLDHLADQSVNFGPRGSGSEFTASTLFNEARVPVQQTSFSHDIALQKLKSGEIAGMVYVAGKPVPLFDKIEVRDGLRLLSLPTIGEGGSYREATITETDYPTLVFGGQTIETFAVQSVLATYNWPIDNERFEPIATLIETLLSHLGELQADNRHPKWREVDPSFELDLWQRHQASETYLRQSKAANESIGQGGPLTPSTGAKTGSTRSVTVGPQSDQPDERPKTKRNHRRPIL